MIDKDKVKALGFEILDSLKAQNPLYDNLKSNFPQTIDADGKPNLKAIATLLGLSNKADMQGYELTFSGKGLANALYSTPCAKELKLEYICHSKALDEESLKNLSHQDSYAEAVEMRNCGFQTRGEGSLASLNDQAESAESAIYRSSATHTRNAIIRGDNLDVLKLLKSAYSEKIKMIYIDPPYNTKNDNFIYPDDFRKDYQEILKEVGLLQENEKGEWIESESLKFFKNITGSKSHSGWLSFMLPRLKLARDLLREDGVIFISIDDNEQANLKILCDEIFGEENFVSCLSIENNPKGRKNSKFISISNEFVLIYAKNINIADSFNNVVKKDKKEMLKDKNGYYTLGQRVLVGKSSNKKINNIKNDKNYSVYYDSLKNNMIVEQETEANLTLIKKGYARYISIDDNGNLLENTYTYNKLIELYKNDSLIFKADTIYEKDRNMFKQQKSLIVSTKEWDLKTESANFKTGNFDLKEIFSMPKNCDFIRMLIKMATQTPQNNEQL
ncbi:site-specific DNA-methyltransferase, partial [Helicobacter marmotae]